MKNNAIQQSFASMATLGNCKKTAEKKQTEGKKLNISADSTPLKASDGTLCERIKRHLQKESAVSKLNL